MRTLKALIVGATLLGTLGLVSAASIVAGASVVDDSASREALYSLGGVLGAGGFFVIALGAIALEAHEDRRKAGKR